MKYIILASASPRRKQLLEWAEVPFDVLVESTGETFPAGMNPEDAAIHIAVNKARSTELLLTNYLSKPEIFHNDKPGIGNILDKAIDSNGNICPVLAADTMVVINNKILGKPADENEADEMLKELSGNKHTVITGVCILFQQQEIVFADSTIVEFNKLTDQQIRYYVEKYKPFDKAGGYAIQEWIGVVGIKSINGDYFNVMGLPVNRVLKELDALP